MDRYERKYLAEQSKRRHPPASISVGVTWVDGRIIFKENKKWSQAYYGVCHFTDGVFAVTPLDYEYPTMITTIMVSPLEQYCEKAYTCLNTECKLNRFDRDVFLQEFKDCGAFSLGIPRDFAKKGFWANQGEWKFFWGKLIKGMKPQGGVLRFRDDKGERMERVLKDE